MSFDSRPAGALGRVAAAAVLLAGCSAAQTAATQAAIADATALVSDIQADVDAARTSGAIPVTALPTALADTGKLQTDLTALSAGSVTVSAILADVGTAISDIGPFVPEIEALASMAATPGQVAAPTKMRADLDRLKADAAAGA